MICVTYLQLAAVAMLGGLVALVVVAMLSNYKREIERKEKKNED